MSLEETETRMSESSNRSLRAALHKNSVEQTNCNSTTRILDAQRKCAYRRLTREEQDVRQQLQLLQLEQKQLSDLATGTASCSTDVSTCDPQSPIESDPSLMPDQRSVDPEEVLNPYPITSRSKNNSGPNTQPDQSTVGSSSLPSLRSLIRDFNDLETSRPWPGDLEAISSIRRGRKPPCRQRIEQQQQQQQSAGSSSSGSSWARSTSLKERPQSSALTRLHAMLLRSKSLRGPDKARLSVSSSSPAGSPVDSGACSRSGSLKDRSKRQFQRRSDDAPRAAGHERLRRSVSLKTKMSEPDDGGSREEERRVAAPTQD